MNDHTRQLITAVRRMRGETHDRNQALAGVIRNDMIERGQFIRVSQGLQYYMPESRRPVYITKKSDELELFLCNEYELNPTENDKEFVQGDIAAFVNQLPINGTEQVLSAYNLEEDALYLHTGADELIRITNDHVTRVPNGHENMLFLWNSAGDTFNPAYGPSSRQWHDYLFHDAVTTVADIEVEEASAVLTAWFMFLIFRQLAASRPILTTLGEPGAGKTVLFKRIYLMLYGDTKSVQAIGRPDDFDFAVASNPFVCFDNIDITTRWLPDKLAQAAGTTDIEKRALYTDKRTILLRRHALVGITSHNPEFTRADVADRLLIITLKRWERHLPEGLVLGELATRRDRVWGGIVESIQHTLCTPRPSVDDAPMLRVQDFAYLGLWFATASGQREAFLSGLNRLALLQRTFALTEEQLLVECIDKLNLTNESWWPIGELFKTLASLTPDGGQEFRFQYRNPATLGRRLVALIHPLRDHFTIQRRRSHKYGYEWSITKKEAA